MKNIDRIGLTYLLFKSLLLKKYFCVVDYVEKAYLSKGYYDPKRKLGVTTHFLETIKQQLF